MYNAVMLKKIAVLYRSGLSSQVINRAFVSPTKSASCYSVCVNLIRDQFNWFFFIILPVSTSRLVCIYETIGKIHNSKSQFFFDFWDFSSVAIVFQLNLPARIFNFNWNLSRVESKAASVPQPFAAPFIGNRASSSSVDCPFHGFHECHKINQNL